MDRKQMSVLERLRQALGKYRWAIAAALLGALLMLLPAGGRAAAPRAEPEPAQASTQSEMEALLAAFDGVGRLRLMLATDPVTERWSGAVAVCEGAGSAAVRLQLTQAISALTGLPSDRIAIMKGKP